MSELVIDTPRWALPLLNPARYKGIKGGRGSGKSHERAEAVIEAHINKRAVGEFVLPGLMKISTVRKPAVKARKGISPFTKEEVVFKAKPATTVVKVRALKKLKDMAL